MTTLEQLEQRAKDHEERDEERFKSVHEELRGLPDVIKKQINGSVQMTVRDEMNTFKWSLFKWFGLGFLVIMVGLGVSWGTLTSNVQHNTDTIEELKADIKDL